MVFVITKLSPMEADSAQNRSYSGCNHINLPSREFKYIYHCHSNLTCSSVSSSAGQKPSQWIDTTPAIVNNPGLKKFHYWKNCYKYLD